MLAQGESRVAVSLALNILNRLGEICTHARTGGSAAVGKLI